MNAVVQEATPNAVANATSTSMTNLSILPHEPFIVTQL